MLPMAQVGVVDQAGFWASYMMHYLFVLSEKKIQNDKVKTLIIFPYSFSNIKITPYHLTIPKLT